MKYAIECWFDRITRRAIIDAMSYRPGPNEDERRKGRLFVAAVAIYVVAVIGFTIKVLGV